MAGAASSGPALPQATPLPQQQQQYVQGAPSTSGLLSQRRRTKGDIAEVYLQRLIARGDIDVTSTAFQDSIREHFNRLPTRYALDVNMDSLDVLSHKRLLDESRADPSAVSFAVRPVEIAVPRPLSQQQHQHASAQPVDLPSASQAMRTGSGRHLRGSAQPAFGSSPNLQALALEASCEREPAGGGVGLPSSAWLHPQQSHDDLPSVHDSEVILFYEITVASVDQPKLLSRLSEALSDLGLNIREAHAFNTSDGFSLDVFVVDQFQTQGGVNLEQLLGERLAQMPPPHTLQRQPTAPNAPMQPQQPHPGRYTGAQQPAQAAGGGWGRLPEEPLPNLDLYAQLPQGHTRPASPAVDDWEIDIAQLQIDAKVASGAFSNLYRGSYCGQEVAVKILKDVADDTAQYQEFLQEVSIMRKVRHKNIVQFIGACTRKPNLCIVFEFMQGGSVYDYIRREGPLRLSQVLRVGVEVSRGMDYLHQRKIIHRDLKAANLLMDDHGVVKIADFGVARIIENTGHMTAETGTYRWMAPEVIEHRPYDEKADVFSFAVVLWELLTCKVPYSDMTPLQAAVGVVQKGLRPGIPPNCPPALGDLLVASWQQSPSARPSFRELTPRLQAMLEAAKEEEARQQAVAAMAAKAAAASGGGLLAKLRGKS